MSLSFHSNKEWNGEFLPEAACHLFANVLQN